MCIRDREETTIATSEETNQAVEIKYVPVAVEEEEPEEQTIFEVVENMPEFPNGGMAGLMQYLSKNIKYPTIDVYKRQLFYKSGVWDISNIFVGSIY